MHKLLIANRGEIACRIMRTAHEMGIATVAVFTAPDGGSPHVDAATEAWRIESYLDPEAVLAAAARSGADAVHPGYGFLSENGEFAQAVIDAGLIWVGPAPDVIDRLGDKIAAKELAIANDVPTLTLHEAPIDAATLDYPVMIKASAGGGGKGMRVVESADRLDEAMAAASREAEAAFNNGAVFVERYVRAARHVEVQVLGDTHGTLIHLGERECSIQRRHQKIIEEAPSPRVDVELRDAMGAAALRLVGAAGYTNAGTVEFLLDDTTGEFWFLEVNTRLQVEHPVTEAVTGIDLVRQQLRIADGLPLDCTYDGPEGHAIEARLYAEDPATGFLPAIGTLVAFDANVEPGVRVDSSVRSGSVVGIDFDPMLAKIIATAPTRTEAAGRLALALDRMQIAGVVTNRSYLSAALRTEAFVSGATTTAFVADTVIDLDVTDLRRRRAAVVAALAGHLAAGRTRRSLPTIPSGLRTGRLPWPRARLAIDGTELEVAWNERRDGTFAVEVDGVAAGTVTVVESRDDALTLDLDDRRVQARLAQEGSTTHVHDGAGDIVVAWVPTFTAPGDDTPEGGLVAPMPGKVLDVRAAVGDEVTAGAVVIVLEAMKMEHHLTAPSDGTVAEVRVRSGDQVDNGAVLVVID